MKKAGKVFAFLLATFMTTSSMTNVSHATENGTVNCELSIKGNGIVAIYDEEDTFSKEYHMIDNVLYDDDNESIDNLKLKIPKSKDLTICFVPDKKYCVDGITLKDDSGKNVSPTLENELPAYSTSFCYKADKDISLDVTFEEIGKKYIDLGADPMETMAISKDSYTWDNQGTGVTLCDFLGINGRTYYNYLKQHAQDNWYIGTRYIDDYTQAYHDGANGVAGWLHPAGHGMNCEGFVDNVLKNTGASHPMSAGAGGEGWVHYLNWHNLKHYVFGSKTAMLNSGVLEYGDVIWIFANGGHNAISDYHHVGIFVGNTSSDDKFWHSIDAKNNQYGTTISGNQISKIVAKTNACPEWVVVKAGAVRTGSCKVKKTSTNPEITNGNSCYSLKGAAYGIYKNPNCSDASWVATMTTDENGDSNTVTLDAGTYYVREGDAPKGYALDKTVHTLQIKAGETYVLKVSDKPTMDPVGVLLGKVDKETNMNKPEGSLPMEGALFTVKFYAGVLSDSDPAADGKKVTRTWVFRTNENGFCYYEKKYLESGDELYLSPTGKAGIPMGTLTIQETQAPEGYLINPQVFTVKITSNNNGSEFVYTYNEPKVLEQSLDLNIVKKEKNKDYAIEGAVFEHTLPDGTTETVTTDANGTCKFKALGYGQHKIREVSAPDEYTVNAGIVTFTVAKDNKITLDSNTAADNSMQFVVQPDGTASLSVEDTLAPYTLKVTKVNEKGKTLEGAEFTIYTDKDCRTELAEIVTDSNGVATTEPLTVEKKYYLKETKAPQGYRIPKDAKGNDYVYEVYTKINDKRQYEYYVNGELHTTSTGDYAIEGTVHVRIVNLKVVNQTGLQMPETGTHTTLILVAIGVACMITAIICQKKRK